MLELLFRQASRGERCQQVLVGQDTTFNALAKLGPSGEAGDALMELLELLERKAFAALEAGYTENQTEWVEVKDK